ncbi:ATP-binding protein [Microbacteriaceae bacterium 4G12]
MYRDMNHSIDHPSVSQDNFILEHYGLNELNFESIKSYRNMFASVKPDHPWNGLETKEFLYKIGAWGKMRNTSKEGLTLAGLLMFSEERIITEVLPQYFLEYRETLNHIPSGDWSKRFTSQDGTWSGNVYDFYFKVMDQLAASCSYDDISVRSALHEALINTLVHADYYGEGGIIIEREKDVFQFSNPGLLRASIEQALEGGVSNLRNPNLFKMFILVGLCKRAGSGLKTIQLVWNSQEWKQPDLAQDEQAERTILTLSVGSNDELTGVIEAEDEIAASYEIDEPYFEEIEKWSSVNNENSVNKKGDSVNNGLNSVNKETNSMNNDINVVINGLNSMNNELDSINSIVNSSNNDINSVNNDDLFTTSVTLQEHTEEIAKEESHVKTDHVHLELNGITIDDENIESELWEIAELARKKKRLNPSTMEAIIIELCKKKPLMLKELAYLLDRTSDGLRNNYLAKLLQAGKIQLKYPGQPNHPKQAYIIVE